MCHYWLYPGLPSRTLETRSLLEIDRERTAGVKLQKELDTTRAAATLSVDRMRLEISALQEQLGNLRENAGMQEGKLQAAIAARDTMSTDLKAFQAQWSDVNAQLTLASADAERRRRDAHELQRTVESLRAEALKVPRAARKQKTE